MVKQLEKESQKPSHKNLHRLRLLPLYEFSEFEITLRVPAMEDMEPGVVHEAIAGSGIDDDEDFEKHSTLPMMVLQDISQRQGKPTPAMESEIVGAASNASVVGLGNILGYIFKYGNNLLIQRGLGAGVFGLYTLGMSVITLVASIFNVGMDNAMIRYVAVYRGKKEIPLLRSLTIFATIVVGVSGILGALLVMFFATPVADILGKPQTAPILLLMGPIIPMLCLQAIWLGGLQGLKEFKRRVFVQRVVVPFTIFISMLIAILFFHNLIGAIVVTFLSAMLTVVINLYFLFKAISRFNVAELGEYRVREWVGFAAPNLLTTIISTVLDSIDTLLLAFFVPIIAIGQYAAALKVSGFIGMPLLSLNAMFAPTIAELYGKGEHEKLDAMFKVVTKWSIVLSLPIFEIAVLFAVPLLEISGKDFIPAWTMLIALSIGSILSAATGPVGFMLLMTGHQRISAFNSALVVVLNVVLGIILTRAYGAFGTAISTALALSIVNTMRLVEVWLLLKMQPYRLSTLKAIGAGIISGVITGALLFLLNSTKLTISLSHKSIPVQLILIPVFLAIYTGSLVLFKIDPEDQVVLDRLLKKLGRGKKKKQGK